MKDMTKRPLGRGLGSLLGSDLQSDFVNVTRPPQEARVSEPAIHETQRIWQMDVEKLKPNTYQPRTQFLPDKIKELAASIKEKGILIPIVARRTGRDQFEIIAGERQWRA